MKNQNLKLFLKSLQNTIETENDTAKQESVETEINLYKD